MNLKSFGCSFIYGTDLPDTASAEFKSRYSRLTWPAKYAYQLEMDYQCYARPGSGNLQIAERCLSQLACNEHALYIIGWTWVDRFDYSDSKTDNWRTIMPVDTDSVAHYYYKNLHSQYRDKLTTLINIKLVIDTLIQKGYPFIMTYMDNLIFETEWHCTPAITDLQNYIHPHMTTFNGMSFLEWSRSQKYEISHSWHPLEPAHSAAAKYMSELGVYKI